MHPIERLRYVARSSGADQEMLVRETAGALASLGFDPAGLVTACRRIIDRHTTSGPLWWLCAKVLTAPDPRQEVWRVAEAVSDDTTGRALVDALPEDATVCVLGWPDVAGEALVRRGDVHVLCVDTLGEGAGLARRLRRADMDATEVAAAGLGAAAAAADIVVLEASAIGPDGFLAVAGSRAAAAVAYCAEVPVWVVGGVGRLLPGPTWSALVRRLDEACEPWEGDDEVVPLAMVNQIVGPDGPEDLDRALRRLDCPVTPELFRPTAF